MFATICWKTGEATNNMENVSNMPAVNKLLVLKLWIRVSGTRRFVHNKEQINPSTCLLLVAFGRD